MKRSSIACALGIAALALPGQAAAKPVSGPLGKVGSALLDLRAVQKRDGDVHRAARAGGLRLAPGKGVLVDVRVVGDVAAAATALRIEGMRVVASATDPFGMVEGRLPVGAIDNVAALDRVRAVLPVRPAGTDVGSVTSQGDGAHRGPQARALGPTGAGITVGVISDSIDQVNGGISESQGDGDLPADVDVLLDDAGGVDEGRAMAEIIYDEAPGIPRFVFSSGTAAGPVGKMQSIDNLVAAGARVIADDIFYLTEPFFQDGIISQAVDRARAAGVAYFASAGNRARQSWEGTYRDDAGVHDFAGGDNRQTVMSLPPGRFINIVLQWDEADGAVQTDLDARLFLGETLVSFDTTDNIANGVAMAELFYMNPGPGSQTLTLEIERAAGSRTPFMKYIIFETANPESPTIEYATNSDAINPDAASANGALTMAAVQWSDPGLNDPEVFSSRGPKVRLFDAAGNRFATPEVRQKPNIAAADGVSTGVQGFGTFFGTSAAAPSAAGIGALILSAKPTNIADDVYAILQEPVTSVDCTAAGRPDPDCGMGFVLADTAVQRALDVTGPSVTPVLNPPAPTGSNGFYVTDVAVSWSVSDDGSPVTSQSGCAPVTLTTDTPGATFTCAARSTGGTTTIPVAIKRDTADPVLRRLRARRRGTRFGFTLTESARVTITLDRRRRGRFRRVRRFAVNGKQGANTVRRGRARRSKPGRYRVRMRASDPAGNTSARKGKRFRVRKRRR